MRVVGTSCDGRMHLPSNIKRAPVAFSLVALSSVVFLCLKELGLYGPILQLFNFVPLELTSRGGQLGQPGQDWWRFVTPTLLHFSWMHVVFNCLWIWEFGRRIELSLGSLNLLGLYLTSAVFSNSLQYFASGPSIFGGMSGVVYAFMGFIWTGNTLRPGTQVKLVFRLPPTLNAQDAGNEITRVLESNAPYGAHVSFEVDGAQDGWHAPEPAPWLSQSLQQASQHYFDKPAMYMGCGGTIPFMKMLGDAYPATQFFVTGLLGPKSNAHGPNEFLHIETGKRLTCCVASVLADAHAAL